MPWKSLGIPLVEQQKPVEQPQQQAQAQTQTQQLDQGGWRSLGVPSQEQVNLSIPPERTNIESGIRDVGRTAKVAASNRLGMAGDIQGGIEGLVAMIGGTTPEQVRQQLKGMGLEPPGHFPTTEELQGALEKKFPSLKPETEGEQKYEEGLGLFSTLMDPVGKNLINKMRRAGVGTYLGMEGKEKAKEFGAGETAQDVTKMILSVIPMVLSGRIQATDGERRRILLAGRRAGLTEEQLAPLLQTEQRAREVGSHTLETQANRTIMDQVRDAGRRLFNEITNRANQLPLNQQQLTPLINDAKALRQDLLRTAGRTPKKQTLITYLDGVINDLEHGQMTGGHLINTYGDINDMYMENVPSQKNRLQRLNRTITHTLYQADPQLARDFRHANRLLKARHDFINHVGWKKLEQSARQGLQQKLITGLITGSVLGKAGAAVATVAPSIQHRIANRLLMDPNWQNIRRTSAEAIIRQSPKLSALAYKQLKGKVSEEMPEDFENINWPE